MQLKNIFFHKRDLDLCREQDLIITIFSDKSYMDGLYNKLLFIKAMQKEEKLN